MAVSPRGCGPISTHRALEEKVAYRQNDDSFESNPTTKEEHIGKEKVVGMAMLTVPPSYRAARRTWLHQIKSGLVCLVVGSLTALLSDQYDEKRGHG